MTLVLATAWPAAGTVIQALGTASLVAVTVIQESAAAARTASHAAGTGTLVSAVGAMTASLAAAMVTPARATV